MKSDLEQPALGKNYRQGTIAERARPCNQEKFVTDRIL
jgi:hypothetical protein